MTIRCTSVSLSVTATALIFCLSVWIPAGRIRLRQQTLPAPVGLDWFILNSVCTTAVLAFLSIPGRFSRTSDWRGARVWKDSTSLTASTALGSQEAAIFVVTWWLITGWPGFWSRQRHWCCWFSPARCEAAHAWLYIQRADRQRGRFKMLSDGVRPDSRDAPKIPSREIQSNTHVVTIASAYKIRWCRCCAHPPG